MSSRPTPCTSPTLSLTVSGSKGRPPARTDPPTKFLKSSWVDPHLAGCHSSIKLGHEPDPIRTGQGGDAYWRPQKSHNELESGATSRAGTIVLGTSTLDPEATSMGIKVVGYNFPVTYI